MTPPLQASYQAEKIPHQQSPGAARILTAHEIAHPQTQRRPKPFFGRLCFAARPQPWRARRLKARALAANSRADTPPAAAIENHIAPTDSAPGA